ncbi:hypothetical protein BCR42DRAFT_494553 [Absidia repens]|uniref:Attractin/MKLN-like beta-propeller domain-containing protein n=1 Tax=Absidia repens TaxID=90262 RepID=A0A1X2I8C8_9FUNG|nr:hypothetical protein BCR42DRAFT_494553 [Absidia repens]
MHQQHYHLQHGASSTLHSPLPLPLSSSPSPSSSSSSSSSQIRFDSHLLPTTGHTLHWIDNALVSFFGRPNQSPVSIIETKQHSSLNIYSPYVPSSSSMPSPCRRSAHTTTSIHDKNNTTQLYLIGGLSTENDEPLADIWKLNWDSKKWINLTTALGPFEPGLMGHVTLSLPLQSSMHLLTCFGANHQQHTFFHHCTLFNTDSLSWKRLQLSPSSSSSTSLPTPRIHTSMISANGSHAVLYGGVSSTSTLLDDLWWVDLSNIDSSSRTIMFTPLAHCIPRAGHTALMVSDSLMLVDGGQYDGSFKDGTTILDLAAMETSSTLHRHQKRELESRSPAEEVAHDPIQVASSPSSSSQGSSGISGGAIGGIIVAVVLTLGVTITLFVFYQRRQRRQRNYDLHSRAVRFSLSTPPRPSDSYIEQQRSSIIQHPDAAKTRLSHMSFGSDFYVGLDGEGSRSSASSLPRRSKAATTSTSSITPKNSSNNNHPNMLDSPSRQLYTNWVCETPVPPSAIATTSEYNHSNLSGALDPRHTSMYINQSTLANSADHDHDENNDDDEDEGCAKKRSSTAFRRFRLSIFRPLDIGSTIAEQQGSDSQQQQQHQDQHNTTQIKSGACGPTSSTANHGGSGYDDQPTTNTTKRRSSMFGLSRFLNIGDSTTGSEQDQNQNHDDGLDQQNQQQQPVYPPYHRHHHQADTRASLGSKSVASLQWVEFNNDMDFDSGLASRHLAVMNHRQSVVTISSSSGFGSASVDDISLGSKPTSPRNTLIMTQQQQQPSFYQRSHHPSSSSSYRLGHRELQSWEDARMSWLGSSPPPPHHRLATRDPTKTNSFPTLSPLNID